ncbi:MAG: HD domain-containing protein [Lachnospiraceae bacterium]|nr:HD domain-containing protein [Lachnospiraceae bacterium]
MISVLYGILLVISAFVVIFMAQKNYESIDIHYWTLVTMIPVIILSYWLKSMVTTVEGAAYMFCFIYLDSTVLLTVVLFNITHFLMIKVRPWIKITAYSLALLHMGLVWACVHNTLYYKSITLVKSGLGTATRIENGPLKFIHWIYLTVMLVFIIGLVVYARIKKGTYSRRSLLIYTTLITAAIAIYVVETAMKADFSLLPLLYVVSDIIIAGIYDKVHVHDISCLISEHQKYSGTRGYAAFDLDGRYLSCNSMMYEFLPELAEQIVDDKLEKESRLAGIFYGLINEHRETGKRSLIFNAGDLVCECEISEFSLRRDSRAQGYLFDVRDVTEEQKVIEVMKDYNETLNNEVEKKTENIKNIQEKVVLGLANIVENRDNNTGGHVKRTSDIIKFVVEEMMKQGVYDIDEEFAEDVVRAAPMHDLGKISIDNSILNKPGKLTDEEYAIMKTHSVKSGEIVNIILKGVEEQHFVDIAFNIARFHHERWDGRGYPEGLVGAMIPIEARIMAIADVYDALVSKRCYKKPMSFEQAQQIMVEGMGSQFDPNMLSVFMGCREELENYYRKQE